MLRRNPAVRWFLVSLTAYALFLHALVMGAVAAPPASPEGGLIASLQELCSGRLHNSELPDGPPQALHSPPCALCGLGHAAVDVPSVFRFAPPANIVKTIALGIPTPAVFTEAFAAPSARPRAPPAFV